MFIVVIIWYKSIQIPVLSWIYILYTHFGSQYFVKQANIIRKI